MGPLNGQGPSRLEAYAAWAVVLITIMGATLTLWSRVAALEQHVADMDQQRTEMIQTLERIEQRLMELGR